MATRKEVTIYKPAYIHPTAKVGKGTKIGAFCDIGKDVIIGENCNIQCHAALSNETIIGKNVFIGPNVTILNDKYMNGNITPAKIGNGAKIGGGSVILPGISVGENALIGAGSVVTKDVKPGKVVYGNPAKERRLGVAGFQA